LPRKQPLQPLLRHRVVRVDFQDLLQAEATFLVRLRRATQPQPGHLVAAVALHDLGQQGARFGPLPLFERSNSLLQQIVNRHS
jgi:hypothetical protein